jgi:hypothetical protein
MHRFYVLLSNPCHNHLSTYRYINRYARYNYESDYSFLAHSLMEDISIIYRAFSDEIEYIQSGMATD